MKPLRVGIDLGTTYSSIGYLDEADKPQPIENAEGEFATPSVVYFEPNQTVPPIVGRDAIEPGFCHPERFVAHAKRHMGTAKYWEIDGILYAPVDISAIILRKLIKDAERQLGSIEEAVVTVPAHFTGYQRQLTVQAGKQAGLSNVVVVNEPVAAALTYVLREFVLDPERQYMSALDSSKSTVLVFDLGGGTFDLSIVEYSIERLRVVAANGEQRLGGIDWDQHLIDMVSEPLAVIHGDPRKNPQSLARLAQQVERAKRSLSTRTTTDLLVQCDGWEEEFHLERADFEKRASFLVERTRELTEGLLKSCNLTWAQLDAMIPVGGSTRMPMVARIIEAFDEQRAKERRALGNPSQDKFVRTVSPDLSIAQGAALFAGIIHNEEESEQANGSSFGRLLANYATQNVTPAPLGILVRNQHGRRVVQRIIDRNIPLPAMAQVRLLTTSENQSRATIRVVEGDSESTSNAKVVCKCTIDNLPPNLPKDSVFDVDLTYDADGLLHVVAMHRDTGRLVSVSAIYSDE